MADARVARRYALALFQVAQANDSVRAVEEDFAGIAGLIQTNEAFRGFLNAPYESREEKVGRIERLFGDRATSLTLQTLKVLLEKGRETEIVEIYNQFVELRREHEGIVYASVTSATVLSPEEKERVVKSVESNIGKRVEPQFHVDPTLLGGVRVAYDSYVLDGTVRGALSKLREQLRLEVLKQA